ncbi:MAG: rhodanese-like domain-containing protein [Smithella sp.]
MNDFYQNYRIKIRAKLYRAIREAAVLFVIAVIIAIIFNALRPAGIPLYGFNPALPSKKQPVNISEITLSAVYDLYLKNKVIFVDARDPFSFEEGHITGAINIYPDEVTIGAPKLKKIMSPDSIIVTYCDGPKCPLSKETAHGLLLQGVPVVKVFVDGWRLWNNAGYPVTKGNK